MQREEKGKARVRARAVALSTRLPPPRRQGDRARCALRRRRRRRPMATHTYSSVFRSPHTKHEARSFANLHTSTEAYCTQDKEQREPVHKTQTQNMLLNQQRSLAAGPQRASTAPRAPRSATVSVRAQNAAQNAASTMASRGQEWLSTILSRFGPARERASNVTTLDFEKPLVELDSRIKEVGIVSWQWGAARRSVSDRIAGQAAALGSTSVSPSSQGCAALPLAATPPLHQSSSTRTNLTAGTIYRSARSPRRMAWTSAARLASWRRARSRCAPLHNALRAASARTQAAPPVLSLHCRAAVFCNVCCRKPTAAGRPNATSHHLSRVKHTHYPPHSTTINSCAARRTAA